MIAILVVILVIENAVDYLTTKAVLAAGGREASPVMRWFIERGLFGPAKIFFTAVAATCLLWGHRSHPLFFGVMGWAIVALYLAIITNNIRQLILAQRDK